MPEDATEDAVVAAFLLQCERDGIATAAMILAQFVARFSAHESALRAAHDEITTSARAGRTFGRYRALARLGGGGQGEVFLALDERLGRRVAVKSLRSLAEASADALARLLREAEFASRLDHPGICAVFDAGVEEGIPFVVMRYVEGRDLAAELTALGDTPRDAAAVMRFVGIVERTARALHAAHEAGVLHRDVKPHNLMIARDDAPVVLDFGIARAAEGDLAGATRTGQLLGTPAYLAPELLAESGAADRRVDVFGLGVVLYECLAGRKPFDAPTRDGLYQALLRGDPSPLRRLAPAVSRDLATVVHTAIARHPDHRYRTAELFADDLQRVREGRPIAARPPGPLGRFARWFRRNPALATSSAALLLVLMAGLVTSLALWRRAARAGTRAETALVEWVRLADLRRLDDLIAEADGDLWPPRPDRLEAYDDWLGRAHELTSRGTEHATALATLERSAPRGVDGAPVFADAEVAWRHHQLAALVARLREFARPDPFATTIASVRQRRADAEVLARAAEANAPAWRECAARVAAAACYDGLALTPQLGLVPLGADPDSHLEEFAVELTGTIPARDAAGRLSGAVDEAVVLVLLPGGTFVMGAQARDPEAPNHDPDAELFDGPAHAVTLAPFFLARYETTQAQWLRATGRNPSLLPPGHRLRDHVVTLRHPVEAVTWNQASEFARRLGLELPTEAQWEYAYRAGSTTPWPGGNGRRPGNLADEGSRASYPPDWAFEPGLDDGFAEHAPVGSFAANPFGLADLDGNVAEWCRDAMLRYTDPLEHGSGLRTPRSPDDAPTGRHARRGSSFLGGLKRARAARRDEAVAQFRGQDLGVRLARPVRE